MNHCAWTIDGSLLWAKEIHDGLTGAQVSGWVWWVLALWADNQALIALSAGVGPEACDEPATCRGPDECPSGYTCVFDPDNNGFCRQGVFDGHSYSVSKTLWALGNFSKFIRPGFVRIGTALSNTSLLTSAYKDPTTGRFVIVAINNTTSALTVWFNTVGFTGGVVTPYVTSSSQNLAPQPAVFLPSNVTIPAKSIVTYA
ncbi:MAG: glycoside hydrolase family 30 beta sandwich domain-containing protein, partial [Acidimicrobiia bacterium]